MDELLKKANELDSLNIKRVFKAGKVELLKGHSGFPDFWACEIQDTHKANGVTVQIISESKTGVVETRNKIINALMEEK